MATYRVTAPDGGTYRIEGPDDATDSQVAQAVLAKFPDSNKPPAPPDESKSGFIPALQAGFKGLKSDAAALAAKTGLMDVGAAENYIAKQREESAKIFQPTQDEWTESPWKKLKELAGGSAAYMAAPVVAGAATLALPATIAPAVATGIGMGLTGLVSGAQFTGSNLTRQMGEGSSLADTELGSAALAAIPQAALDVLSLKMIPGVRGIFGAAGKKMTVEEAEAIATQGLKRTVSDYALSTGKTMGVEGLTEAGQQVFERLQAGLSLTDEKAQKEYLDSFLGGAALGGAMAPVGRYFERGREQREAEVVGAMPGQRPGESLADAAKRLQAEIKTEKELLTPALPVEMPVALRPENIISTITEAPIDPVVAPFIEPMKALESTETPLLTGPTPEEFSILSEADLAAKINAPNGYGEIEQYKQQLRTLPRTAEVRNAIAQAEAIQAESNATLVGDLTGDKIARQGTSGDAALNLLPADLSTVITPELANTMGLVQNRFKNNVFNQIVGKDMAVPEDISAVRTVLENHIASIKPGDTTSKIATFLRSIPPTETANVGTTDTAPGGESTFLASEPGAGTAPAGVDTTQPSGVVPLGQDVTGIVGGEAAAPPSVTPQIEKKSLKGPGSISGLNVRPPSDNINDVIGANFDSPIVVGNQTVNIDSISGGVRLSDSNEVTRVAELAKKISGPNGYISRIIVDGDNNVIEGQHRLEALRSLGVTEVPVYKIEEASDKLPVSNMKEAVASVGNIRSEQVNQIVNYAVNAITENGIDGAGKLNMGAWQKHYDAAINVASIKESKRKKRKNAKPKEVVAPPELSEVEKQDLAAVEAYKAEAPARIAEKTEQFKGVLSKMLSRMGLKDVAVKIMDDVESKTKGAEGSYSAKLIKIALDAQNPVRVLNHEVIHALKELGFFTDSQWKVLTKQANESWVDTYLKNRGIDGNPLQQGEQSRYDAYMEGDEFKSDPEAIVEEAIADAFGDFDVNGAPSGMLKAILNRLISFFDAIKSALQGNGLYTSEQAARQVFGKIARGELTPGKAQAGEEKLSLGVPKPLADRGITQEHIDLFKDMRAKRDRVEEDTEFATRSEKIAATRAFNKFFNKIAPLGEQKITLNHIGNFVNLQKLPPDVIVPPADAEEVKLAKEYAKENGIAPYINEGLHDLPLDTSKDKTKFSIKTVDKFGFDPVNNIPLNKNGTVTLYYHTTKSKALAINKSKVIKSDGKPRIYLTNESNGGAVLTDRGNMDQDLDGSAVLVNVNPDLVQKDVDYETGRVDFFIPLTEGEFFAKKMQMASIQASRKKALTTNFSFGALEDRITNALTDYYKLSPQDKRVKLNEAKAVLKSQHNIGTLLSENGKLQKTRIGDYGLKYEGNSVASMGLGLAAAQKISEKISTCPNSAICEGLCLGETSGGNLLYGGAAEADVGGIEKSAFRAGPRMAQYLKTEAMIIHPEEFAILLDHEINLLEKWAAKPTETKKNPETGKRETIEKEIYTPAIRLNVTSDFKPSIWTALIEGHPDTNFYDYTKLNGNSIGPKHHLTYSSTGVSQVVNGEEIVNEHSNWASMKGRLDRGFNVAMAFTTRNVMPKALFDEESGKTYEVWDGDNYDARFLDPKSDTGQGMIVGLTNKDFNSNRTEALEKGAAKKTDGFFVDYDPKQGDTVTILDQSKFKQAIVQRKAEKRAEKEAPVAMPTSRKEKLSLRAPNTQWTDERIESLLSEYAYFQTGREGDAKAYATLVKPKDFLDATSTKEYRKVLEAERFVLDTEELRKSPKPIWLEVKQIKEGVFQITGHEGRHRMMALRDAGVDGGVPVVLKIRPFDVAIENAPYIEEPYFEPQIFTDGQAPKGFYSSDAIPISYKYKKALQNNFGGEADIKFSLRAPDTKEFKQWFGDSKVVDENGDPLVTYHATNADVTEFEGSDFPGWFSASPELAERYLKEPSEEALPNVMPAYLSIKNPLSLKTDMNDSRKTALDEIKKIGFDPNADYNSGNSAYSVFSSAAFQEQLFNNGYDGVFVKEDGVKTFAPILNNQIKSATGNIGTYSKENPDIRYSLRTAFGEAATIGPKMDGKFLERIKNIRSQIGEAYTSGEITFDEYRERYDKTNEDYVAALRLQQKLDESSAATSLEEVFPGFTYIPVGTKVLAVAGRYTEPTRATVVGSIDVRVGERAYKSPVVDFGDGKHRKIGLNDIKEVFLPRPTKFSLRTNLNPAISAAIDRTVTHRIEEGWAAGILKALSPKHFSEYRQVWLNRYNQLGVYDKMRADRMGGFGLLADASSEAAAMMSDYGAGLTAAVFSKNGGVPVYANGMTTISNLNGSIKAPLEIFAPLLKLGNGDPYIYSMYQFWAGVKRGTHIMKSATNPAGTEINFTPADIAKAAALERQYPDFVNIQKDWIKYNNQLSKYLVDTGVISGKARADWIKYADYIPFYRQMDDEQTLGPKLFQSLTGVKPPKTRKGESTVQLSDFLETIIRNTQSAIQMGIKNTAGQKAVTVALSLNNVGKTDVLEPLNYVSTGLDSITILVNGQKKSFRSNDRLWLQAVTSLNLPDVPFMGLFAKPAQLLRTLVTKEPGFMLANMIRDSMSAHVTSGVKGVNPASTLTNFGAAIAGKSPEFQALFNAGILGGHEYSKDIIQSGSKFASDLRKTSGYRTASEKVFSPVTGLWDALEKGTTASDAATRMQVYKEVLAQTKGNEAEAIYRAVEVMNFNRKGNSAIVRVLTAAIPFLNARIQGLDVFYRAAFGKGTNQRNADAIQKQFFIRGATMMAMSCMYWALTHDDDDYKKQEQETKDNYWLLPSLGIKLPIPFEVGVLFKVIPERIMAVTFGKDTNKDFTDSMTRQLVNTFAFNPIPQVFKPLVEYTTNYNFFTGRPIVGQGMEGVETGYQTGPNTSAIAADIGKATGMSPLKLDQLVGGFTGTMGMYAFSLMDSIYKLNGDSTDASKRFEQSPVLKRFLIDPEARGTVTAYYETKNATDAVVKTAGLLERTLNFKEWGPYYKDNIKMIATHDYMLSLEKSMKDFREMKLMIRSSAMSPDQKRDALLNITKAENKLTSNIQVIKKNID